MGAVEQLPADGRYVKLVREHERRLARRLPVSFCRTLFPDEPPADHSQLLLHYLHQVETGKIKRLMVLMPPGHAKSTYCSVRFPSWYLGKHPKDNIIQVSHTGELAKRFGRRVRNIVDSAEYQAIFNNVWLADDSKARGDWGTSQGGEYYACGMDGGVTGRRANGLIMDDPIKGRKEADSETVRENAWETYRGELRTRLKKDGWIILILTRWHEDDVAGRILPENWHGQSGIIKSRDGGEEWMVVCMPALIDTKEEEAQDLLGRQSGEALWPGWISADALKIEKNIQGTRNWGALYQQKPSTEEGAIMKAAYWREWPLKEPPTVDYILQVYDTAFEEGEENDYSARTTWGIFNWNDQNPKKIPPELLKNPPKHRWNAILLEHWQDKVDFPKLKREAKDAFELYQPDRVLIEKKASGHSLLQELRRAEIPVKPYQPDRGKVGRAHAAAAVFEQGCVWHMRRSWANKVIRQCAQFPNGEYDDTVDTVTAALIYLRRTWHLQLKDEEQDEVPNPKKRRLYG